MKRLTTRTALGILLATALAISSFAGCSQIKEVYCEKVLPAMASACLLPTAPDK